MEDTSLELDALRTEATTGLLGYRLRRAQLNVFQRFNAITISIIRPEMYVVVLTGTIAALKVFGPIYALTRGGPGDSTIVPSYYAYSEFFQSQQVGYGATIATALTIVVVALTIVFILAQNRSERLENER